MGRKAGMWIAAATAVAVAGAATAVFGAGASGPATVKRPDSLHLRARVQVPLAAKGQSKPKPPILYGATNPQPAPVGDSTVALGGCPRRYHITNGSVAALHGSQA